MDTAAPVNKKLPTPSPSKQRMLDRIGGQYSFRSYRHELQQLFWECTLRCNLHCQHCGSDCRSVSEMKDMPLEDFLKVLDDVRTVMDAGQILVVTTGGEPLLRQDIFECGKSIRERGFHWGMVSNGMLLNGAMCDQLQAAGLETIAISVDGFEQAHNWLRGDKNSFAMAERAIRNLVGRELVWDVITCVNKLNFNSLDKFKDYLIGLGVSHWRIFTVVPMGRGLLNNELQLDSEQFLELMYFIEETRKEGNIKLSYGCEGFLGNFELEVRDYPFFCQSGINVASILADGSISGCLSVRSHYHQGNIYQDKFSEVWANRFEKMRNREWMRTGICAECDAWRFCQGNGMHVRDEQGNLMRCHYASRAETI